jgi:spermidine synthase
VPPSPLPDAAAAPLRYYTPAVHRAAFVLPRFAATRLQMLA